jgi:hypothetical protein
MYVRQKSPLTIADKRFTPEQIDSFLLSIGMTKAERIYYGYSSAYWPCKNTNGYILDKAKIIVDYKDDIVTGFWVDGFRFHTAVEIKKKLHNILLRIGNEFNVILNDWDLQTTIDLLNSDMVEKYLNEEL